MKLMHFVYRETKDNNKNVPKKCSMIGLFPGNVFSEWGKILQTLI